MCWRRATTAGAKGRAAAAGTRGTGPAAVAGGTGPAAGAGGTGPTAGMVVTLTKSCFKIYKQGELLHAMYIVISAYIPFIMNLNNKQRQNILVWNAGNTQSFS